MPFAPVVPVVASRPVATAPARPTRVAFLTYIHNFRAIAILFIVAIHCYATLKPTEEPIILQRGTLLFMFISGFLFQHLSRKFDKKVYWRKKLTNILLPYFFVSIPIILFRILTHNNTENAQAVFPGFNHTPDILKVAEYYISGTHLIPFWFIPMICFYYLLAPVFIALDRDKRIYYLLPLFMGLSLVVTRSFDVYKIHLAFVHYLSIYLLGMFASRYQKQLLQLTNAVWPLLLTVALISIGVGVVFNKVQIHYIEQFLYCQKLVLCWTTLFFLWKLDEVIARKQFWSSVISKLSDMSFGIFFLHYYFLFFIGRKLSSGEMFLAPNFLNFFIIMCADIIFCVLVLSVLKQLFGKNSRYIVGY